MQIYNLFKGMLYIKIILILNNTKVLKCLCHLMGDFLEIVAQILITSIKLSNEQIKVRYWRKCALGIQIAKKKKTYLLPES